MQLDTGMKRIIFGIIIGLLLTFTAWVLDIVASGHDFSLSGLIRIHDDNALYFLIDFLPVIFATVVYLLGRFSAPDINGNSDETTESLYGRMTAINKSFLSGESSLSVFTDMLNQLLDVTNSEFGFIGDVIYDNEGAPFLKSRAISNIAWDQASKDVYRPEGMEFRNLNSLFGYVLTTKKVVLTNDPDGDRRSAGTPHGHPPLESFLGIPLIRDDRLIGMVGLANRREGYIESLVEQIDPLISACANVLWGMRLADKLQNAQRRYRDLFDDSPIMYVVTRINSDRAVIISECNGLFCRTLGYDRSELIGRPVADLLTPQSKKEFLQSGFTTATTVGLYNAHRDLVAKNGSVIHTELVAIPDKSEDGTVVGGRAMFVNLTKEVEARQQQEGIAAELSQLIDIANAPIFGIDQHGSINEWNQAAAKITGISRDVMIGRDLLEVGQSFAAGERVAALYEVLLNALSGVETSEYEFSLTNQQGETVDLLLNMAARRNIKGAITGVIVIGLDISERNKMERARIEKDRLYRHLTDELPVSVWEEDWSAVKQKLDRLNSPSISHLVDYFTRFPDFLSELNDMTKVLQVNPYTYTLYELVEENGSRADPEVIDHTFELDCGRGLAMLYFGNKDLYENYTVKSYKNNDVEIQSHTIVPDDAKEDWSRVITIDQDRTDLIAKERSLRQAQKMEAVGQLTGGIAHDFNNLLSIISGNIQILQQDTTNASEEVAEAFTDALSATKDGAELTQRLLSFSRMSSLCPEIRNICDLIENFSRFLERTLGDGAAINVNIPTDDLFIYVDASQLENSLLNLALNARDATPNGGAITISASRIIMPSNSIGYLESCQGDCVKISVSDSGTGIEEKNIERVFEPFFTTKEPGKGSGLGLSMVYGFAKQSGGCCEIDSCIDEGTTVSMYFPAVESGENSTLEVQCVTPMLAHGSGVILVVEDEPRVRRVVLRSLNRMGYETREAENANAAKNIIESGECVDLILSDIVMPGELDGYGLADWAAENYPHIKIILTSGYHGSRAEETLSGRSRITELKKPYSNEDLAERLSTALAS